jgi:iron complex outermembrane receptor protein
MPPYRPLAHALFLALGLGLALPATLAAAAPASARVYDRAAIERSGAATLAEFLRGLPQLPFGVSRPGIESEPFAQADYPGLGANRTQVLIDGRPMPQMATGFGGANLATIPLALVERVEIIPTVSLATQGSGAAGGAINLVLRRVADGGALAIGASEPQGAAGAQQQAAAFLGLRGEHGGMQIGIASERSEALPARERPGALVSGSTFANNFQVTTGSAAAGYYPSSLLRHPVHGAAVPGGCIGPGFSLVGSGSNAYCRYDPSLLATAEPELRSTGLSAHADFEINEGLAGFVDGWLGRARSEGQDQPRIAFDPAFPSGAVSLILIPPDSPNHPANRFPGLGYDASRPVYLRHRFVASGALREGGKERAHSLRAGLRGERDGIEWSITLQQAQSRLEDRSDGVLSGTRAAVAIASGQYDIYAPYANSPELVDSFIVDGGRDASTSERGFELIATSRFGDFAGGSATWSAAADYRRESLQVDDTRPDFGFPTFIRDGDREHAGVGGELRIPFHERASVGLAARHDRYDSVGGATSGNVELRWEPGGGWWLQADAMRGFVAPRLAEDLVRTGPASYSIVYSYYLAPGCTPQPNLAVEPCGLFVREHFIDNPDLESERHRRWRVELGWAYAESFTASLAWFDHAIDDRIQQIGATALVQCAIGVRTDCPDGIGILPLALGAPDPRLGLGVQLDPTAHIEESLLQRGHANFGSIDLRGAELRLSARRELRDLGSLEARFDAIYLDTRRTDGPCSAFDECLGNPGLPRVRALLELAWTRGDFALGWQLRHTGGTSSTAGVDPQDGYDGPARLPSWTVHDAQLRWRAPWQAEFAFGVRNLFDRAPVVDPVDPTGEGYDLTLYEGAGRTPYLQYRQAW